MIWISKFGGCLLGKVPYDLYLIYLKYEFVNRCSFQLLVQLKDLKIRIFKKVNGTIPGEMRKFYERFQSRIKTKERFSSYMK